MAFLALSPGLGPFKVEIVSIEPYISIIHDIVTDVEMDWMIEYSVPRLSKSRDDSKNGR